MEVVAVDGEPQNIHESAVPEPLQEQLQRIQANDPSLTKVTIRDNFSFNKADCGILAHSLSQNTCVTILDLEGTHIGPWAALLCPAIAHLTSPWKYDLPQPQRNRAAVCRRAPLVQRPRASFGNDRAAIEQRQSGRG